MTIIAPELHTSLPDKACSEPLTGLSDNAVTNLSQPLHQSKTLKSALKTTNTSISLVISKKKLSSNDDNIDCENIAKDCVVDVAGYRVKAVSRGRRRSADKQYRPSQPTGNNGGGRTSSRRSGRSYQNYDNHSSNGNSGADGNGEDNDDSDDDDEDEYNDEDDDEDEEEEDEEEDEEEEKNEEEEEDENRQEKNNGVDNSIDEKVLASFGLKVPGESSVVLENSQTNENSLAQVPPGTPVTLQGIICHETMGGVLVVNIKWRNKIYCGSLMDSSRHSWARPGFQSIDGSCTHQGKTRLGKTNGRGKGKGKGKRLRSDSLTSTNSNNHTESPLKQKLRGRKKTISGSSVEKRQGFRSSKRKPKNDEDSDDSSRPGKRNCSGKGAPSPQPSPTLIECPEPGCEKKYKHINGLRYHQAHAHLESKNQDEDNNSDDRSSTTPSPSEEFKEPDPLTTTKNRGPTNVTTRSSSEPAATSVVSSEKEPASIGDNHTKTSDTNDDTNQEKLIENESKDLEEILVKSEDNHEASPEEECPDKPYNSNDKQNVSNDGEFVEVADKSTDTQTVTTTSYTCTKHTPIAMDTVVPDNELPEVADTQEVWETVLDSGCVTSSIISTGSKQEESAKGTSEKDSEGQQVMITTTSGINQLGIEVEDISENEEDIDPGQDVEFNSREEMEKAVENLQSGSFVTSLSTENNLQMLSSLKDPSLIFGLTNRERVVDDKECNEASQEPEPATSLENMLPVRDEDKTTNTVADSNKSVFTDLPVSCSISVETLVSRSISASKHEPPLTNADNPSSRFKYFSCISYGDETYSDTASNITNTSTSTVTTLSLIRDPELIKRDTSMGKAAGYSTLVNTKGLDSSIESVGPSYTGSVGFNQDCTTSSIHSCGPKEELKQQSTSGVILTTHDRHTLGSLHSMPSFSSPKTTTSTTTNSKLHSSHMQTTSIDKNTKATAHDNNVEEGGKDNDSKPFTDNTGQDKKDEDSDKSCVMFVRQPSTLIPKHSRPSVPSLPVGVAHPYQYSSVATTNSTTTGLSVTSHKGTLPTEPAPNTSNEDVESRVLNKVASDKYPVPVGEVGPVNVKRPAIHAGLPTVIPVGAPSLKTAQACLNVPFRQGVKPPTGQEDRSSTPVSLRMASSPRSMPSSPRPVSTSPKLSPKTSVPETKAIPSKPTPSQSTSSSSKPSDTTDDTVVVIVKEENESKADNKDLDRKPYHEPPKDHLTPQHIPKDHLIPQHIPKDHLTPQHIPKDHLTPQHIPKDHLTPQHIPKDHLTPQHIQLYQLHAHQRQMMQLAQAGIDPIVQYAYMRNFAYDMSPLTSAWPLHAHMSPEQMKLMQQQRLRVEEERMEQHICKTSKEESSKVKVEKRESSSPQEGRAVADTRHADRVTSTPPRLERQRLMLDLSPGEGSRSVTGETGSRAVPCLEPPEKKSKVELASTSDDTDRELQKLRHKRQEEYLSKQSMQHKFAMFKQLESTGGAAKTHSIPPLIDDSKRDEDYHKTKSHSTQSDQTRKYPVTTDTDDSSQSLSPRSSRDPTRDVKAKHGRMPSSEPFIPTQFQDYLQHSQMFDPSTGKPVSLIPGQIPAGLDATSYHVSSRLKDRDSTYKSPSSPQSRPARPHSPSSTSVSTSKTLARSPYKTITDRPSSSPSIASSNKTLTDRPSSSPSIASPYKTITSSSSIASSNRTLTDRPSSSPSIASSNRTLTDRPSSSPSIASSNRTLTDRPCSSPSIVASPYKTSTARTAYTPTSQSTSYGNHSDSHVYRVPTSSPSRASVLSRADKPRSPLHHTESRRSESSSTSTSSSSRSVVKDGSSKRSTHQHDVESQKHYGNPDRQKEVDSLPARPGIISNNLAVRRGDVTASMLMPTHGLPDEDLLRRHSYLMYSPYGSRMLEQRQQQHDQVVYAAMMSSAQQNTPRTDQYYGKRQ